MNQAPHNNQDHTSCKAAVKIIVYISRTRIEAWSYYPCFSTVNLKIMFRYFFSSSKIITFMPVISILNENFLVLVISERRLTIILAVLAILFDFVEF